MSWLTPLGFLGLIGLLILLLIYILKPNYQNKFISSTFVWKLSLKYKKKRKEAIDEYEQSYGSLFIYSDTSLPYSYVTEPFPWETEV